MPYPWTPRDYAVGNNLQPTYTILAKTLRRVAEAQRAGMASPPAAPEARAPTAAEPVSLFPGSVLAPPTALIRRAQSPLPADTPTAAPAASGLGSLVSSLTPDERAQIRSNLLGGAGAGLQNVLQANPQAGIGSMLLGAGVGAVGGEALGRRGIRFDRREQMAEDLTRSRIGLEQAKQKRAEAQAQRLQQLMNDPNVPESQRRILELSLAGVPAAGLRAIAGSNEPLVPVFDPEKNVVTYAPRSQAIGARVPPGRASTGGGTALMQNAPFVARALNVSEGDAVKMLLTPSGGRKTPEQMEAEFAKALLSNPLYGTRPEEAAAQARKLRVAIETQGETTAGAPFVEQAPTGGGIGDWVSSWFTGEEAPAAPAEAAPAETGGIGDIESMGLEDLMGLDQYSMSQEERDRAAARWDELNAGGR